MTCPALPNTNAVGVWVDSTGTPLPTQPTNGQSQTNPPAYLDYDLWAWNSFVAMNWPATKPTAANKYQRGFPDPTTSFAQAKSDRLTVWETYKEKREVFLYDYIKKAPSSETPQPWNSAPQYGPTSAQVPCCPGADCSADLREMGSASKLFFDTLDETAEVASEALETQAASCAGWVDPSSCKGMATDHPCCTLQGHPAGPRVWRGQPLAANSTPVVYEVKVNYDSFSYITQTGHYKGRVENSDGNILPLYTVANARKVATSSEYGPITLPARTSASLMPPAPNSTPGNGPNSGPTDYDAATCLNNTSSLPCLSGAVHLKAAWLMLGNNDNKSKYHTTEAFSYQSNTSVTGGICKAKATFGLVGLHIIQRIHEGSGSTSQPPGGTYVFTTFEHTGNDTAGFTYANFSGYTPSGNGSLQPYPNVTANPPAKAIPLTRLYPILPSTARANELIHKSLKCKGEATDSVWCNYQLIGTQYAAANAPTTGSSPPSSLSPQLPYVELPPNSGQPFYLANLVVESNVGLQQFQGLPPSSDLNVIQVIDHYSSVPSKFNTTGFQRGAQNLAWRTQQGAGYQFTMGGCMGCHGVAQLSGYSFSFVLLDNQYGAAPDTQTQFAIPPTPK